MRTRCRRPSASARAFALLLSISSLLAAPGGRTFAQVVDAAASAAGETGAALAAGAGAAVSVSAVPPLGLRTSLSGPLSGVSATTVGAPLSTLAASRAAAAAGLRGAAPASSAPAAPAGSPIRSIGAIESPEGSARTADAVQTPASVPAPSRELDPAAQMEAREQIVAQRPALGALRELERRGVDLEWTGKRSANAAGLRAAADALPAGRTRDQVLALSAVLDSPAAGLPGALSETFDNERDMTPRYAAPEAPARPKGLRRILYGIPFLGRALRAREARSRPAPRPVDVTAYEVPPSGLRRSFPVDALPESTEKIAAIEQPIVGQDRALESLKFGINLPIGAQWKDYNIYVSGPDGSGRETAIRHYLQEHAKTLPTPPDLVQVTNFDSRKDVAVLELRPGDGRRFKVASEEFFKQFQTALPQVLFNGELAGRRKALESKLQAEFESRKSALDAETARIQAPGGKFGASIDLVRTETGFAVRILPTYQGKAFQSQEELDAKIAAGEFTDAELKDAVKVIHRTAEEKGEGGPSLLERYVGLQKWLLESQAKLAADSAELEKSAAGQVAASLAGELRAVAAREPAHDDPAHRKLEAETQSLKERVFAKTETHAIGRFQLKLSLARLPMGLAPKTELSFDGQPLTPERLRQLLQFGPFTQEDLARAQEQIGRATQDFVQNVLAELEAIDAEAESKHRALHAAEPPPSEEARAAAEKGARWVDAFVKDVQENYESFLPRETPSGGNPLMAMLSMQQRKNPTDGYRVKVLIDNKDTQGAPVVFDDSPIFEHLVGKVKGNDRMMMMGGAAVKMDDPAGPELEAGTALKANGGYLAINVMKLVRDPASYDWLMHLLDTNQAEISEAGPMSRLLGRGDVHKIPLRLRVILYGSPTVGMILDQHDPQFLNSFKVRSQFDHEMAINAETTGGFLQFFKRMADKLGMPILQNGMESLLEFAAEVNESNEKFTARFGPLWDIIREAEQWAQARIAREPGAKPGILRADVDKAILEQWGRENQLERQIRAGYVDGQWPYDSKGAMPGRINGVAVISLSRMFGVLNPSTIVVAPGEFKVESVDRNSDMTGHTAVRAIETVEKYLRQTYGAKKPLRTYFAISNEHNLSGTDGDSGTLKEAAGAELTLAGVKIKQNGAMTGSMDQFGRAKPIGGESEKLKNHFYTAKERGELNKADPPFFVLPQMNVRGLALPPEIVQAVRDGLYKIYFVRYVQEAEEIFAENHEPYAVIHRMAAEAAEAHRKAVRR